MDCLWVARAELGVVGREMRRKGRWGTGSGEMDTDSDVGNETRWVGLPDDIASDGGDCRIAVETF